MNMKRRCLDKTSKHYKNYGGRGISVCDRWLNGSDGLHGFECFLLDVGKKPDSKLTLERVNNDGNYDPGNCKWATRREQRLNTRHHIKEN